MTTNYVNGEWRAAGGELIASLNPSNHEVIWQGRASSNDNVQQAVDAANAALSDWRQLTFKQRSAFIERFVELVAQQRDELALLISQEAGKPLWESEKEVQSVIAKLSISQQAYHARSGHQRHANTVLDHAPHGVMAVFGPYNFPCHLPNGHIIPALLAGNTVVFKPSELTPACGEFMVRCWHEAGLPAGVLNLVQGAKSTGQALAAANGIDGVLFTGSEATGLALHRQFAGRPEVMLALELGGNNPLVIGDLADTETALDIVLESAFISSGQRCTCARRLLVPEGAKGDAFVTRLVAKAQTIPISAPLDLPSPFMAAMISAEAASHLLSQQATLIDAGAISLLPCRQLPLGKAFVSPGIIDVTAMSARYDEEVFGPLLQIVRYQSFDQAIALANQTRFGLSAGLLGGTLAQFDYFKARIRAGIVNWNTPLTGASSAMPFGGVGRSGNHRPSAYYAADYCSYPVASLQLENMATTTAISPFFCAEKAGNSHE